MYERHLAYSNPRKPHELWADERYVVLRWTPEKAGNPNGPGRYEVLVEDARHNVIGWQYPMRFAGDETGQAEARAEANKIWVHLRKSNVESQARLEASRQREMKRQAMTREAWDAAREQLKAETDWDSLSFGERRTLLAGRAEQILNSRLVEDVAV